MNLVRQCGGSIAPATRDPGYVAQRGSEAQVEGAAAVALPGEHRTLVAMLDSRASVHVYSTDRPRDADLRDARPGALPCPRPPTTVSPWLRPAYSTLCRTSRSSVRFPCMLSWPPSFQWLTCSAEANHACLPTRDGLLAGGGADVRRRRLLGALRPQLPAPPSPSARPAAIPGPPQFPWNFFESTREATADVLISGHVDHAGACCFTQQIPGQISRTHHISSLPHLSGCCMQLLSSIKAHCKPHENLSAASRDACAGSDTISA